MQKIPTQPIGLQLEANFDERILAPAGDQLVFPVYTVPLHEERLKDFCSSHGIVHYLPLRRVWKIQNQRHGEKNYTYRREILRPMFPSYLFACVNKEQRSLLFRSESVLRICAVHEAERQHFLQELQTVRKIELIGKDEELDFNPGIREGDKFLIESGEWQGTYGWLRKRDRKFLWLIEIECIGGLIQATIDPSKYKMTRIAEE